MVSYVTRTGLDPIERAALATLAELGALPDQPHRKTAAFLLAAVEGYGYAPDDVHRRVVQLCHPWLTALRTIDFHGNCGSRDFDAAAPRYTEVRLTPLGVACAEAEAGTGPPLPIGLTHGDLHKGGTCPPLDPDGLVEALRAIFGGAADAEVLQRVGPPTFPAGCLVTGDIAALQAGSTERIRLRGVVEVRAADVVVTTLPPEVGESEVAARLMQLAERDRHRPGSGLPIGDAHAKGNGRAVELVLRPRAGTSPEELARLLPETWGIEVLRTCAYPAPLVEVLRAWAAQPDAARGLDRFAELRGPGTSDLGAAW